MLTIYVMSHITISLEVKDSVYDFPLLSFNFHILKSGSLNIAQYVKGRVQNEERIGNS